MRRFSMNNDFKQTHNKYMKSYQNAGDNMQYVHLERENFDEC